MKNLKAYICEAIGTFVLVFCACGVASFTGGDLVPTALAFGLVIVAMAYSIGRISGCHINPAVSLACLLTKRMKVKDFLFYCIAQVVGGLLGALAVFGFAQMAGVDLLAANACNGPVGGELDFGGIISAILVEIILTFIFVYVILNVTEENNKTTEKTAGLFIGLTLTLVHLIGIGFTGTSVNPARSIATAFASLILEGNADSLASVWIFIIAPLVGALIAALVYKALHKKEEKVEE